MKLINRFNLEIGHFPFYIIHTESCDFRTTPGNITIYIRNINNESQQ